MLIFMQLPMDGKNTCYPHAGTYCFARTPCTQLFFLQTPGQLAADLTATLQRKLPNMQLSASCADPAAALDEPAQALKKLTAEQGSGPKTLVVCAPPQADWTLAAEIAYLDSLSKATKTAFQHHVMAYVSDRAAQASVCCCMPVFQTSQL